MNKERIVVVGSANVDFVMKVSRLPGKGETAPDAEFVQTLGGKGANQAAAAAQAGGITSFVGCVGSDPLGEQMKNNLDHMGVDTSQVTVAEGARSGAALVMIGADGQNYVTVAPGANYSLTPERIHHAEKLFRDAAVVLVQCEILPETIAEAIGMAHSYGAAVILNAAPARPLSHDLLRRTAVLVVNEVEASALCGFHVSSARETQRAADSLLKTGAGSVIVTVGRDGVFVAETDNCTHIPAVAVRAVDTTAAGDVFCGALGVGMVDGASLVEAARFASAAAAISVTRLGAQSSIPSRKEIDALIAERGNPGGINER